MSPSAVSEDRVRVIVTEALMQYEREYGDKRHRELSQKMDLMTEKNDALFRQLFEYMHFSKGQGWMARHGSKAILLIATLILAILTYFLKEHVVGKVSSMSSTQRVVASSQYSHSDER